MQLRNTYSGYGSVSKVFHWLTALLVIGMLSFGFFMGDMPKEIQPTVYFFHKSTGLLIFTIVCLRIVWALSNKVPALPISVPNWQAECARALHFSLYLLLLAMPLSGLLMSVAADRLPSFYGLFTVTVPGVPKSEALAGLMSAMHNLIAWTLISLISLHVLAAFRHHFLLKDNVLRRMLPHKVNRKIS